MKFHTNQTRLTKECLSANHLDGRVDSDVNHTVRDILLTGVDEVRRVVVQTCPVSFAPGVVVGAHVKYWVNKYIGGLPWRGRAWGLEGCGLLPLLIAKKKFCASHGRRGWGGAGSASVLIPTPKTEVPLFLVRNTTISLRRSL